ncbi:MAG: MPT-synthase sulfurylase [Alphaproteobacteria bacterium]|nr:MPT-synthase sulfurylase [Alphaproteobacteria bacterium]
MWLLSWLGCATAAPPEDPAARVDRIEKMYDDYRRLGFAKVPDIEPDQLSTLESPVLVDVRPPEERKVSMIPGAITKEEFEADPEKYRGHTIVPYCTIGARSGMYGKKLMNDGWEVRNLKGSILLWTYTGQPLEGPQGPTHEVHTYGRRWALVADGYHAVY